MHFKALKVFCDVVTRRSFSRGASENGISQSGASQLVHQLEEHLGAQLIDRSKRPFVLTAEGELFYRDCRKLVRRYFELEENVRTLHEEAAGRVNVASIYSIGLSHMNRYVKEFLTNYPKSNVRIEYQHPERVYELVGRDQVHLGLVSYPRSSRSIKAIPWREEPMVLVCAPEHSLASRVRIAPRELDGVDMVGFDDELEIRREIDHVLADCGVGVRVVMKFDNIETIKQAIEINAGVGLLPEPTVVREVQAGSLVAVPLSGVQLSRPLGIICRRGKEPSKATQRFIELLLDKARTGSEQGEARSRMPAVGGAAPAEDARVGGRPGVPV